MIPILLIPTAIAAYGVYDKFFKSDEEKKAEEDQKRAAMLYAGVGTASLLAIYLGYKASGAGDR